MRNDVLFIKRKGISWNNWQSNFKGRVEVHYTNSKLSLIEVSAGGKVTWEGPITSPSLDIEVSSGGDVDVEFQGEELEAEASSGAKVYLRGTANAIEADASSGGKIYAFKLMAKDVDAEASSGGLVQVTGTGQIDIDQSSGGKVQIEGEPRRVNMD